MSAVLRSKSQAGVMSIRHLRINHAASQLPRVIAKILGRMRTTSTDRLVLYLVFSLPGLVWLMHDGFPVSDDGILHRWRLWQFWELWRSGHVPVRWAPEIALGLGTPLYTYYGPLGYLIGIIPMSFGLSSAMALEVVLFGSLLFGGLGMFAFAQCWWRTRGRDSSWAGFVAAVSFQYTPYVILVAARRAALGEIVALAIAPWFLLAVISCVRNQGFALIVALAISTAGIVLAHTLTMAVFGTIGLLVFNIDVVRLGHRRDLQKSALLRVGSAGVLALLISGFFWLPTLAEIGWVHSERLRLDGTFQLSFRKHFIPFPEITQFRPIHDFQIDLAALPPTVTHLGLIQSILLVVSVGFIARSGRWRQARYGLPLAIVSISLFLVTPNSRSIWESFTPIQNFQFPWRFLGPVAVFGSVMVAGFVVSRKSPIKWAFLVALISVATSSWVNVRSIEWNKEWDTRSNVWDYELGTRLVGLTSLHEFLPAWVVPDGVQLLDQSSNLEAVPSEANGSFGAVQILRSSWDESEFAITAIGDTSFTFDMFYFPTWSVTLDGVVAQAKPTPHLGFLSIRIPDGNHIVRIVHGRSPTQVVGDLLTVIGLITTSVLGLISLIRCSTWNCRLPMLTSIGLVGILAVPAIGSAFVPTRNSPFLPSTQKQSSESVQFLGLRWNDRTFATTGLVQIDAKYFLPANLPIKDLLASIQVFDEAGVLVGQSTHPIGGQMRQRSVWTNNMLLTDRIDLRLEPTVKGALRVHVGIDGVILDQIDVQGIAPRGDPGKPVLIPPPEPGDTVPIKWGELVQLDRFRLTPYAAERGTEVFGPIRGQAEPNRLRGELSWRRIHDAANPLNVIVQMTDSQNNVVSQTQLAMQFPTGTDRIWQTFELGPWPNRLPDRYRLELRVSSSEGKELSISTPARLAGLPFLEIGTEIVRSPCECVPDSVSVVGVDYPDGMRLLGYERSLRGSTLETVLYWQASGQPKHNYTSFAHQLGSNGALVAQFDRRPYNDTMPSTQWKLGQVIPFAARLPFSAAQAPTLLRVGIYDAPANGPLKTVDGRPVISLGMVAPMPIASRAPLRFANGIELVGRRIEGTGSNRVVWLYWRATRPVLDVFSVFVHAVDWRGNILAQGDSAPESGERTTKDWPRGELIFDPHRIQIPSGESVRFRIGLYRPGDTVRLKTESGDDSIEFEMDEFVSP